MSSIFSVKTREISKKDFWRLLAQVRYDLCQRTVRKGDLAEVGPLAGCPKRKSLCAARYIGQPERRKPAVVQASFLNFRFLPLKSFGKNVRPAWAGLVFVSPGLRSVRSSGFSP